MAQGPTNFDEELPSINMCRSWLKEKCNGIIPEPTVICIINCMDSKQEQVMIYNYKAADF
jgi:hypothetical protein